MFFNTILDFLVNKMSADDEKWITEHRMSCDMWRIFFLRRNNGWKEDGINRKTAMILSRDILDAKQNRIKESPFSKNPHLAQLSSMLGLDIFGKKINQPEIREMIMEAIKAKYV